MANELSVGNTFLDTLLKGDGALVSAVAQRIYADFAPEGRPGAPVLYPQVLYSEQATADVKNLKADVVYAKILYWVRVITPAGYSAATDPANRIDALLRNVNNYPLVVDGLNFNIKCMRQRAHQMPMVVDGITYRARGGFYWVWIEEQG